MPIPKEFSDKFANEAEFTTHILMPLLRRMGFSIVCPYHGPREFGRDLVFGEIDQFGHVKYHAMQAKYVASVSQGDSHGLVEDCREAFAHPFIHPSTNEQQRINTFYAVNGGSIAENARTHFFNSLQVPHGGQVRLLDGVELLALDRFATYGRVEQIGELLSVLILECEYNRGVYFKIQNMLTEALADSSKPVPSENLRTNALRNYLIRPNMLAEMPVEIFNDALHVVDSINAYLDGLRGVRSEQNQKALAQAVVSAAPILNTRITLIQNGAERIIQSLGPLVAI